MEAAEMMLGLNDETSTALPGEAEDVLDDVALERSLEDRVDSHLNVNDMVHWQDGVIVSKRSKGVWWSPVVYRDLYSGCGGVDLTSSG